MGDYYAVYRYLAGPSKGLAFWAHYDDQAAFEATRSAVDPSRLEVVVAGVSKDDAIAICDRNLPDDLVASARAASTSPTTGEIIPEILRMHLMRIGWSKNSK